ncbi:Protein of uncharacterised function (DUF795) [Staphylococcus gallinarum]|uniref:Protein of uncharacterized function (DUF795) n=1 Tax=Staphylococcus gallinarum TaxID=1293 RepID=A0A380FG30_STAGA|nr:Protein of uncharacterised function (DUF795) [Staphylococcus gallinarum]
MLHYQLEAIFGDAAVRVANYLNVDHLAFGSESGDINAFLKSR